MVKISIDSKVFALISYLWVLFLIPLLIKKKDVFAHYHAKQGLMLFIAITIVWGSAYIPVLGWFILGPLGGLFCIILWIFGIYNTLKEKKEPIPIIGRYAEKWEF
ncbi:MAG TPA: hypothetical protein VJB89_00575 [Candidatus Nanoarchaeia archaeon]|nr:hypothetical protein [Candidatus Nanoarchaeia archaeon]